MILSGLLLAIAYPAAASEAPGAPTITEAQEFILNAEKRLEVLNTRASFADWVLSTYIIYDTEKLAADTYSELTAEIARLAGEAKKYESLNLPYDVQRKILLLKLGVSAPAPKDPQEQKELAEIGSWLEGVYGKGKYCPTKDTCMTLQDMEEVMRTSSDPKILLDVWKGWRTISPPMKEKYSRFAELSNKGARDLGFKDTGVLWRSGYEMTPEEFALELDRLWNQVKPLYDALHTYVRSRLVQKYGKEVVGDDGLIPAHLLGNMWSQSWDNIYELVAPPQSNPGFDLTQILQARKTTEIDLVKMGERFFTSLGFEPLPQTFWERSQFTKPKDREVVCHASANNVENPTDLRIKMCIKIDEDNFSTIHHELGHDFYFQAYGHQSLFFRDSANDGFHEALGDTIALSVTPEYLKKIGLLETVPGSEGDLGLLLKKALERVAFLPFGLLVDRWRWKVFSGEVGSKNFNQAWWDLVRQYQGIKPPVARSEKDFDPGAKYHIPANVPYTRYFLASILQFQFYRELCRETGYTGPLHRCSFYQNKKAGAKLQKMMAMGISRPWPEALEALTGKRQMDATAIIDYFAPLKAWLDEQNKGQSVAWK
jgi:peptidyl-dipeptidase A